MRAVIPSTVVSLRREDVEDLIRNKPEVGLRPVSYTHLTLPTNREV